MISNCGDYSNGKCISASFPSLKSVFLCGTVQKLCFLLNESLFAKQKEKMNNHKGEDKNFGKCKCTDKRASLTSFIPSM